MKSLDEINFYIQTSIDNAFKNETYDIDFFDLLTTEKISKTEVNKLIQSNLFVSIKYQIEELDVYLHRGSYYNFIQESYGWMGDSRIQNFRNFLNNILEDAIKYAGNKRGRKPGSKAKKKKETTTTNK